MPLPTRPSFNQSEPSAAKHFIDRDTESAALADALTSHIIRATSGEIDDKTYRNLVSFYGIGGIGKSALSQRLESWLGGTWTDGRPSPPAFDYLHTARWELNDSKGNVDVIPLLMAVRSELHEHKASWPAFDLAFAAYFTSARPGEPLPLGGRSKSPYVDGLIVSLSSIAEDLGHSNLLIALSTGAVRALVDVAQKSAQNWKANRLNPELGDLLNRCLLRPSRTDPAPDLAAEILWQLSLEIDAMKPAERPNLVVFIDHFERVQNAVRGTGEETINRFVAALPFTLFVVTGRNLVDWYRDERVDLYAAGRATWPALVPGVKDGARQHLLDRLSDEDTRALILRHRDRERLNISDDVVEGIVASTKGWPVHIDAVATYARRLHEKDPERSLSAKDLGGSLDAVVRRLVDDLPDNERRVFQAACVLPFFDVPLVRAVADDVNAGAVHRCIARALILENSGSAFPYRVHDEIRAVVRSSAGKLDGGWSEEDWHDAAVRGLDHARSRFESAAKSNSDQEQLLATALAIHIGAENDIDLHWIAEAIRTGPSITGLRAFIPASDRLTASHPARSAIELVELLDEPADNETIKQLLRIKDDPVVGVQAHRWAAYRLRDPLCLWDDSIVELRRLLEAWPDKKNLYQRQIAITYGQARRFHDAIKHLEGLDALTVKNTRAIWERSHGDLSALDDLALRADSITTSRRYKLETLGTLTMAQARIGQVRYEELESRLADIRAIGHRSAERSLLKAMGYFELFRSADFGLTLDALHQLRDAHGDSHAEPELLALRAMATKRNEFAEMAYNYASTVKMRPSAWIPTEIFLEHLGLPLEPQETQWLEPYEGVRDRWLNIAEGIIHRAGNRA